MNPNWLPTGFFFGFLLIILYGAFLILGPFLKAITWAAILAILFYPAYAALLKLFKGKATLAALTIVVLVALIIVLPGVRIVDFLTEEVVELVKSLRALANGEGIEGWTQQPWVQQLLQWWGMLGVELAHFQFEIDWREMLIQGAQLSSAAVLSQVKGVAQNIFLFVANFIIVLLTFFFFLRDGADICYRLRRLVPMDPEHQEHLFQNIVNSLFAVVHGCLVVAMIQGLLAGLAYWAVGVPYAVLWGVVTAFAALLPVGGTTLVTVPVAIYLFLQGDILKAVLLLIWSIGVVGTVDNVLKPMYIGTRLKLPMLLLFFGILGGLSVFGALGFILGPVLFALLAALLDLYLEIYGIEKRDRNVVRMNRKV
ncbi:MAG TPA: AI-2E family transporter [Candidatus Binatia bacterium]|nr:AI-2E family transporter [Candidatus Binatia bacterium]